MAQQILVVDDDPQITRLLRAYLEQDGYAVDSAATGTHALHALQHTPPDLLILDLMLPDHSGWDLTRLIRRDVTLAWVLVGPRFGVLETEPLGLAWAALTLSFPC